MGKCAQTINFAHALGQGVGLILSLGDENLVDDLHPHPHHVEKRDFLKEIDNWIEILA